MNKICLYTALAGLVTVLSCHADTRSDYSNSYDYGENTSQSYDSVTAEEKKRKKHKDPLPDSDFDFEANTVMVDVNGESFPVVDVGEGPVVLLVHGWPDSKELWRYQIPFLVDEGYRVIAPDLRGFGDAPKTEDLAAYGLLSLIGDIVTILDELEVGQVNLVAHDWGAAIGWTMARFVQDRIKSYVAISVGAPGNPGFDTVEQREKTWYYYLFSQPFPGLAEYEMSKDDWRLLREFVFHPDEENVIARLSDPEMLSSSFRIYRANLSRYVSGCFEGPFDPTDPFDVDFPLVTAPTLGLLGSEDFAALRPSMSESVGEVEEGKFEYKFLRGLGHWMMLERPNKINKIIKKFLDCQEKYDCN